MSKPADVRGNWSNWTSWLIYLNQFDGETLARPTIDYVHHKIHEGDHFTATVHDLSVDIAAPKYVCLLAPDSLRAPHLIIDVSGSGAFELEFYEDPTMDAAGSAVTAYNNDRRSGTDATVTLVEDCTTQAPNGDGTLLFGQHSGGEKKAATARAGSRQEWILNRALRYIIKVTVEANATDILIVSAWYEHTPSNA